MSLGDERWGAWKTGVGGGGDKQKETRGGRAEKELRTRRQAGFAFSADLSKTSF